MSTEFQSARVCQGMNGKIKINNFKAQRFFLLQSAPYLKIRTVIKMKKYKIENENEKNLEKRRIF